MKTLFFLIIFSSVVLCQSKINFEFYTGLPYNLSMPLIIKQNGFPDISITAKYRSEPLIMPIFWIWRFNYIDAGGGYEFEAVHHKIYLENNPPEIQEFSISHGYNYLIINRIWLYRDFLFRTGVGIIFGHAESTIRNKKFDENGGILGLGYYIAGPALNLSAAKHFEVIDRIYLAAEARINAGYANVPVVDGRAHVYNLSAQLIFGFGINFYRY